MQAPDDWLWLDGRSTVDRDELARMCGLTRGEVDELEDYGSLAPTRAEGFDADLVAPLREAVRLRVLFDLDLFTAGLLMQYLLKIERLESQLRTLRGRLPAHQATREGPGTWLEPHA